MEGLGQDYTAPGDRPDGHGGASPMEARSRESLTNQATGSGSQFDDDEDVCRICRTSGDPNDPLYYPCACSGSIKYVHQECLLQWLSHSNARHCEVCKHAFAFSPIYAENAPAKLPTTELLVGACLKTGQALTFLLRLFLVLSVWLVLIPFATCWLWRLSFVRTLEDAHLLIWSRTAPVPFFTDCVYGSFLAAGIVFLFLSATTLRDYFRRGPDVDNFNQIAFDNAGNEGGQAPVFREGDGQQGGNDEVERVENLDGQDDVPFQEMVGMRGPLVNLMENALTVMASNAAFLAVVVLLPFTIGRMATTTANHFMQTPVPPFPLSSPSNAPFTTNASALYSPGDPVGQAGSALWTQGADFGNDSFRDSANMSDFLSSSFDSVLQNDSSPLQATQEKIGIGGAGISEPPLSEEVAQPSLQFSDGVTVAVGVVVIGTLFFIYAGGVLMARYVGGDLARDSIGGNLQRVAQTAPALFRHTLATIRSLAMVSKVAVLLTIELGVFPFLCGWWLDLCTLHLLDSTFSQRVAFLRTAPLFCSMLHWVVGILFMVQISVLISLLREILRPEVLSFLRDPADPNYNPLHDLMHDPLTTHARRVLLSTFVFGNIIVTLVFFPVRAALLVAPHMFPLNLRFSDPFTEIPADMLIFHICIPFAVEHFRPRSTVRWCLFHWFRQVGFLLGLAHYLLPNPNGEVGEGVGGRIIGDGREEEGLEAPPPPPKHLADEMQEDVEEEEVEEEEEDNVDIAFITRIVALCLLAWFTLLLWNTLVTMLPVAIGRSVFAHLSMLPFGQGLVCNDMYAFGVGCYSLWGAGAGLYHLSRYLQTHSARVLVLQLLKWGAVVVKSAFLLSIWIVVVPILIGLLFELLLVVPLRVPMDESPLFLLYQDWALGLLFLKIWTRLVMMEQPNMFANEAWRTKLLRVKEDGFSNLNFLFVTREIVGPVLRDLLTAHCVPFVFARGVAPLLHLPLTTQSAIFRFAWLCCLAFFLFAHVLVRAGDWVTQLHNSIRDDRYLVGRRLHNFREKGVGRKAVSDAQEGLLDEGLGEGVEGVACSSMVTANETELSDSVWDDATSVAHDSR